MSVGPASCYFFVHINSGGVPDAGRDSGLHYNSEPQEARSSLPSLAV